MVEQEIYRLEVNVGITGDDRTTRRLSAMDRYTERSERRMRQLDRMEASPAVRLEDRLSSPLSKIGGKISSFAKKAAKQFAVLATAGAVLAGGLGISDAVQTFASFEQGMKNVQATSMATDEEMARLTDTAKQLGSTTAFSAKEASDGMNYLAMAGFKTNEIIEAMPGLLDLAAASGSDLAVTSDIVSDALTAFGMSAQETTHLADVMARASSTANTNVELLGESFKYSAAPARAFGMSAEEATTALAMMANAGIKGSMAGTALRGALTRLSKPPKQAAAWLDKLGISVADTNGKIRPFNDILGDMRISMKDLTQEQRQQAIASIFGQEAMSGMLAVLNTSTEDFESYTQSLRNADGAAKEMANMKLDSLSGQFTILKSAVEGMKIELGERLAPYTKSFVSWLTENIPLITEKVVQFVDKAAEFGTRAYPHIVSFIEILKTLSPILAGIAAGFAVFKIGGMILAAVEAFRVLQATMTLTLGPLGMTAIAIGALVAAGIALYQNWDVIKAKAQELWSNITSTFESLKTSVLGIWEGIKTSTVETWNSLVELVTGIWAGFKEIISNTTKALVDFAVSCFEWLYNHNYYFQNLVDFVCTAWENLKAVTSSIWNAIKGFLDGVWSGIKTTALTVWNAIKTGVISIWNSMKESISSVLTSITSAISTGWNAIKTAASTAWNEVKTTIVGIWTTLKDEAYTWATNMVTMFIDGIKDKVNTVGEAVSGVADRIAAFLGFHSPTAEGPCSDSDQWAGNFMQMYADGIAANQCLVEAEVNNVAQTVKDGFDGAITHAQGAIEKLKGMYTEVSSGVFQISDNHTYDANANSHTVNGNTHVDSAGNITNTTSREDMSKIGWWESWSKANPGKSKDEYYMAKIDNARGNLNKMGSTGSNIVNKSKGMSSKDFQQHIFGINQTDSYNKTMNMNDSFSRNINDLIRYKRKLDKYYDGAGTYHDGGWVGKKLKSDEVPAVLQAGEFVLSRDMLSKLKAKKTSVPSQTAETANEQKTYCINIGDVNINVDAQGSDFSDAELREIVQEAQEEFGRQLLEALKDKQ